MINPDIPRIIDGPESSANGSDSCLNCIHYHRHRICFTFPGEGMHSPTLPPWRRPDHRICAAFPEGIPSEIWQSVDNHRFPVVGDHGLQYSRRPYPDPLPDRYDVPDFLKKNLPNNDPY